MKSPKSSYAIAFLLASGVFLPLSIIVSEYLFLGLLTAFIILLWNTLESNAIRLWVIYLYAFQFFGVSVLGLKIYDLVTVFFFLFFLLQGSVDKRVLSHPSTILFVFFLVFIAIFGLHSNSAVVEATRYFMCLVVLLLFGHFRADFNDLKKYLLALSIINLVQGVMLHYILYYAVGNVSVDTESIKVSLYYFLREPRISGFADDPNKYYTYAFFIILLYELLDTDRDKNSTITRYVCLATACISLSRSAILVGAAYWMTSLVYRSMFARARRIFNIIVFLVTAFVVLNFDFIVATINFMVEQVAVLTGRTRTLEYEPNITTGNRMYIWGESFKLFTDHPLTGNGLFAWEKALAFPPHNTVLVLLLDVGLIGFVLYLLTTFPLQRKVVTYPFFFLYLLPALTLDMQHYRLHFILLSVILFYSTIDHKKDQPCAA
jgi:hypothetical protein